MNIVELVQKYNNKKAEYLINGMIFKVLVINVKVSFGQARAEIIPIAGHIDASAWVNVESIILI